MAEHGDICRTRAEHCRQQAAKTVSSIDKQQLLRLSEEWLRLAQRPSFRDELAADGSEAIDPALRHPTVH
ncbi:hypothetical protein CWO90_19910 [Bradyrhizobium sp. Leo121]|nr:hypothetical protein CWO90_19910 [Bradyrhizobium sp. Leo121]